MNLSRIILFLFLFIPFTYSFGQNNHFFYGEYDLKGDSSSKDIGKILLLELSESNYYIYVSVSKTPSFSSTSFLTSIQIKDSTAFYSSGMFSECLLKFIFKPGKIEIKELSGSYSCGTTQLSKTFTKENDFFPTHYLRGDGKKIELNENSEIYHTNFYKEKNSFNWNEDICDYTGYFLNDEYGLRQINNAFKILDTHNTERQTIFSFWYNYNEEFNVNKKIKDLDNYYKDIDEKYNNINQNIAYIPNETKWNEYILNNKKSNRQQLEIQKVILKSFNNPSYLVSCKYYNLFKNAADVLNSNESSIRNYYMSEFSLENKTTSLEEIKKYIFSEKIEATLYNTFKSRNELFNSLFYEIIEECYASSN